MYLEFVKVSQTYFLYRGYMKAVLIIYTISVLTNNAGIPSNVFNICNFENKMFLVLLKIMMCQV